MAIGDILVDVQAVAKHYGEGETRVDALRQVDLQVRAGEVIAGHPIARSRRMLPSGTPARDRDLARGPARLAAALGISREHGGIDLLDPASPITLHAPGADFSASRPVRSGPRVGVRGPGGDGATFPWRFWIEGDPTVSPYRREVTSVNPSG